MKFDLLNRKAGRVSSSQIEIELLKQQIKNRDEIIHLQSIEILELQMRLNELEEIRKKYIEDVKVMVKEGSNKVKSEK